MGTLSALAIPTPSIKEWGINKTNENLHLEIKKVVESI